MSENIYEMLNESKINLEDYDTQMVSDIEKAKMKKQFRASIRKDRKNNKNKVAAVALVVALSASILTVNFHETVFATIDIISTDIATKLGISKKLDEYKTIVNNSVTDEEITIKLSEVILDGDTLIVSSTIKTQDVMDETGIHPMGNIKVNGRTVKGSSSGSSKKIDDHTMEEVMEYKLNGVDTRKELNIKIDYKDAIFKGKTVKGKWSFAFKASGEELAAKTQSIELNHKIILENGVEINLYKYTTNDIGQKIFFTKTKVKNEKPYNIVLKGSDNLGNPVEFGLRTVAGDKGEFAIEKIFSKLSEKVTEITLTPYAVKYPEKSGKMSNDLVKTGDEFKIKLY